MKLLQFAVPARIGAVCAESATIVAGGATLISGAWGWWTNGRGEIEREEIQWLIVGVDESQVGEVVEAIKGILRGAGESAVFYVVGSEPKLEWL